MTSLATRIWLLVSVSVVVAIVAYLAATRPFRRSLLVSEAARDARDDVLVMQAAIARGLVDEKEQDADLLALAESIAHAENVVAVGLYTRDGSLLAGSARLAEHGGLADLARQAFQRNGEISALREKPRPLLEHAIPLKGAGRVEVAVVVRDISYVDALVGTWTRSLLTVGGIFAAIVLLIARPMVRHSIGVPLDALVRGVEQVSAGQLDVRVSDARKDELGRLASAFNAMTQNLQTTRARVDQEGEVRTALEAQLRRLSTLAAAGEMAASIAHEVGSPLNVILGRTRMMAAREGTPEPTKRDLAIVAEQTERITRVVQRLLDLTRPSRAPVEQVVVRQVAEEVLAFLGPECKKRGVRVRLQASTKAPTILASRDQLVQVLFNLCHNALQAQPKGGLLEVEIRPCDQRLEVRVSDRGPGVDPSVRGRIFDPFVTTKGDAGTGLGLAIVAGLVRDLGGKVEVEDVPPPEHGACFVVSLPAPTAGNET